MNPLRAIGRAVRRAVATARNALLALFRRESRATRQAEPRGGSAPVGGEYRRTFDIREDAEFYAREIPLPTLVKETDSGFDVYIVYGEDEDEV